MTNEHDTQGAGLAGSAPPSPPPPHGPRLRWLLPIAAMVAVALVVGALWSEDFKALYHRLHPAAEKPAAAAAAQKQYYTCGMHPWVVLPEPGECPICHMKLVPLDPQKFSTEIAINPVMTQNIGVRIAPVTTGPVQRVVRTVGSVDYNETLVRDVSLKISGWVEKLYVNSVGQAVEKDQPLLEIYSPDLYSAQEEYLLVFRRREEMKRSGAEPDSTTANEDLLESARKKLEYLDVSAEQIREIEKAGHAARTMVLRSPLRGTVVAKTVLEGQKIEAGMPLMRVADLSKVWVLVTIYEYQVPFIEVGQKAVMSLPYLPGQTFEGKVTYAYPYLNPESRQAKVRLEFDNPTGLLKPGMFASVELVRTLAGDHVLVPREAVIDTGVRQIAFVSLGEGRFDPRDVRVGVEAEGGMIEILDGLKPGEMIEARRREALAKMVRGNLAADQATQAAVAPAGALKALPDAAAKALSAILDDYFQIGAKLADDSTDGVAPAGKHLAAQVEALVQTPIPEDPSFWRTHTEVAEIGGSALAIAGAGADIAPVRDKFGDLSIVLSKLLRATGIPPAYGKEVQELHCPMFREKQGGTVWLQPAGEVRNPYYGKMMLGCFDRRVALPVTGAVTAPKPPTPAPAPPAPLPAPPQGGMPPMPGM